ncbi:MAG: hypothetical protein ABL903_15675, partial [Methylococcales bacterium]
MADNTKRPLKVALHAMNERSVKTMVLYLKGPCQGAAVVVDEASAERYCQFWCMRLFELGGNFLLFISLIIGAFLLNK